MKKILTIIFIVFFIAKTFGQQWPYKLSTSTVPYSPLTSSTSLNNGHVWTVDSIFKIPLTNFSFTVDGNISDTLYVKAALGILFDVNYNHFIYGYSTVYGGTSGSILVDKGTQSSLSPVSYKITGTSGSKILTIEWKNTGYHTYFSTDTNTFVNYQISLFENDNHIEIHYGPSLLLGVVPGFQPFVRFKCYGNYGFYACSNASNPTSYWVDMTQPNYCALDTNPSSGTLFKIEKDPLFNPSDILENINSKTDIYPNPGSDVFYLRTPSILRSCSIIIFNTEGEIVISKALAPNENHVDVSNLPKGIYFVKLTDKKFGRIYKYVKL